MAAVLAGTSALRWTGDWGEWAVALSLSLVLNLLAALGFVGWLEHEKQTRPPVPETAPETVALIHPDRIRVEEIEKQAPAAERPSGFARTSPEQASEPSDQPRYLGERDTRGASELEPVAGAVEVPSQSGIEPRREGEVETTESRYQDGTLEHDRLAPAASEPTPPPPPPPTASPQGDPALAASVKPGDSERTLEAKTDEAGEPAALPEPAKLLDGPSPVDRPKPPEELVAEAPKERPPGRSEEGSQAREAGTGDQTVRTPPPRPAASPTEPGFRGFQRKTRLQGAISRRGVASLDVADSALGRYYAELSRAVEREWQRNCVRYRDHITPGWITVRFVVTERGEVRSIAFVEAVEVGEIQKGFTLNSIRQAAMPKMSDAVKRELEGEPLELIYNFYF